jgi:GNAT superfamily N-acetyltransferase
VTPPGELAAPHGAFLLGYENGRAIACGGLRRLEDRVCEIKRMYVVPDARSRGVGRALLKALEAAAGQAGYERVRLDAGPRQHHSRALFPSAGYIQIAAYNTNHIASYWGEKTLATSASGVGTLASGAGMPVGPSAPGLVITAAGRVANRLCSGS